MPTRKPIEALAYAKQFIKSMPLERVFLDIAQNAYNYMWFAAPWRWTVGTGMDFPLVAGQYEYIFSGGSAPPADYLYLTEAKLITDANSQQLLPLEIVSYLPATSNLGTNPTKIAELPGAIPGTSVTYRVYPVKQTLQGTNTVVCSYKRKPRLWDPKTIFTTAVEFPDEWFYVFQELVLYYAYKFANDDRTGGATVDPDEGKIVFNGQRGLAETEILLMKSREKIPVLDQRPVVEIKDFKK